VPIHVIFVGLKPRQGPSTARPDAFAPFEVQGLGERTRKKRRQAVSVGMTVVYLRGGDCRCDLGEIESKPRDLRSDAATGRPSVGACDKTRRPGGASPAPTKRSERTSLLYIIRGES
jgi:hypothetical protein